MRNLPSLIQYSIMFRLNLICMMEICLFSSIFHLVYSNGKHFRFGYTTWYFIIIEASPQGHCTTKQIIWKAIFNSLLSYEGCKYNTMVTNLWYAFVIGKNSLNNIFLCYIPPFIWVIFIYHLIATCDRIAIYKFDQTQQTNLQGQLILNILVLLFD